MSTRLISNDKLILGVKTWYKLFYWPIVKRPSDIDISIKHVCTIDNPEDVLNKNVLSCCDNLQNALLKRTFDHLGKLDQNFETLAAIDYSDKPYGEAGGKEINYTADELAAILALVCKKSNIFWNAAGKTTFELKYFKQTIFGKALYNEGCILNIDKEELDSEENSNDVAQPQTSGSNNKDDQPQVDQTSSVDNHIFKSKKQNTTPSRIHKNINDFRSAGAQSSDLRGLVGKPGEKFDPEGDFVYRIIDRVAWMDTTKNDGHPFRVFIRPLLSKGKGAYNKDPNKNAVYFGTDRGYGVNVCWFDDEKDAQNFLNKLVKSGYSGSPSIEKKKADKTGYFIVETSFGEVGIRAYDTNEDLDTEEQIKEDCTSITEEQRKEMYELCDKFDKFMG